MKSSARRVVGIVISMLLGLASQSWAQERTAFVCEGRIGNAATNPNDALRGDFEYDIGTNTAAPQQVGQFQWESGYPFNFTIQYAPGPAPRQAMFTLGPTITSTVPAEVFADTHALGNLNLRVASLHPGSGVWLGNLELTTVAGITNLPAMVTSNQNQKLDFLTGQPLAAGFSVTGTAVFWWQAPNIPGRSHLQFQISAVEPQQVVKVEWIEDNPEDDVGLQPGNPESHGGGMRFYAEKKTPTGSVHNKVKAKATLAHPVPAGQTVTVHFQVFDMDDPTQNGAGNVVDDNDTATERKGDDNRNLITYDPQTGAQVGMPDITPKEMQTVTVNAGEQVATVEYTISAAFAGNNWRVAAHLESTVIEATGVDTTTGLLLKQTNTGAAVPQSPLLSVWRTLHVEVDSMEAVPARKDEPDHCVTRGNGWGETQGFNLIIKGRLEDGVDFYAGGILSIGDVFRSVFTDPTVQQAERGINGNTSLSWPLNDAVRISGTPIPSQNPDWANTWFALRDDDDRFWPPEFLNAQGTILPQYDLLTSRIVQKYAPAYIRVVEEVALNTHRTVPFALYENPGAYFGTVADNAVDLTDANFFWVHTVVAGYQPDGFRLWDKDYDGDGDPPDSNTRMGRTTASRQISVVYFESIRDVCEPTLRARWPDVPEGARKLLADEIESTVAHEIGHGPGSHNLFGNPDDHDEGGLMGDGGSIDSNFTECTIRRFRNALKWNE